MLISIKSAGHLGAQWIKDEVMIYIMPLPFMLRMIPAMNIWDLIRLHVSMFWNIIYCLHNYKSKSCSCKVLSDKSKAIKTGNSNKQLSSFKKYNLFVDHCCLACALEPNVIIFKVCSFWIFFFCIHCCCLFTYTKKKKDRIWVKNVWFAPRFRIGIIKKWKSIFSADAVSTQNCTFKNC